jgi:Golgi SNAP receptor complex protein 2
MTSIGELFPKCRKLAYDARQQLAMIQQQQSSLQASSSMSAAAAPQTSRVVVSELYLVLEELNRQLDSMEQLLLRETPAQRQMWKHKISELRQEAANLQQQGQAAEYAAQRQQHSSSYQREREDLLLRRRRRRGGEDGDMQNLAEESQSLEQSQSAVLGLISQGEVNLSGLVEQRQRLRGVTRVLADMGSSLGLTQSTMRIIERRDITDAYLVAAGMVVTLLVIYFVWF